MSGRGRPPFNSTLLYKQPGLALRQVIQYADPDPTEATVQGEWFWGGATTQNLAPGLYTNSNNFFSATISYGLFPSRYDNSNQFYGSTVTPGTVTLLPDLFVNNNQFFPCIVQGVGAGAEGGGPSAKGWAIERRKFELSIQQRQAQRTLAQSNDKLAKKVAKRIERFVEADFQDEIDEIVALQKAFAKLEARYNNSQQLSTDLREAARVLQEFIQDEQDAIDLLLLVQDFDARCVIQATVQPLNVASLMG